MKSNISIFESILRIFIGMTFAGICGAMYLPIGVLALYPIVTGLTAWDPIYAMRKKYTNEINPYEEEGHAVAPSKRAADDKFKMSA